MDEERLSADDIRRELEREGFSHGTDRLDLIERARDAYSEVWESSRKRQQDHENALAHALADAAPFIRDTWRKDHA